MTHRKAADARALRATPWLASQYRAPPCSVLCCAALGLAALAANNTSALAQTVRGRVIDDVGETPVVGAVVVLLNDEAESVGGVLTDGNGLFSLVAPAAGEYRLRAEMIGRRSGESASFVVADQPVFQTLVLPVEPIQLAGLDVDVARRCSVVGDAARATHVVWSEARKALRAESVTRDQAMYRYRVAEYHRRLDRRGEEVIEEEVEHFTHIRDDPFSTLPADVLARDGYVREERDGIYVYGPTTGVFLSQGFQDTHCFALRRDRDRPGLVGLVFEPVPGRDLPDIEGVLWLDERSAELRTLEFRYRNIPRTLARGEYSGFARFQRLTDGGWIIRSWWLRSPINGRGRRVTGMVEEAGEVLSVEPIEPTVRR